MTREEILALAQKHDPDACWATDWPDENCLLIDPDATVYLLDRVPDAYEDPNPPGQTPLHTRLVFPSL